MDPGFEQFSSPQNGPFGDEAVCTWWQGASYQRSVFYPENGLHFTVLGMEMRRSMVTEVHSDDDAEKRQISGIPSLAKRGIHVFRAFPGDLQIQRIAADIDFARPLYRSLRRDTGLIEYLTLRQGRHNSMANEIREIRHAGRAVFKADIQPSRE